MSIVLGICTFVLILTSLFLIFVVLLQRAKSDGGMGAAMGGGAAEATFGADTGNVLSKATINAAIIFFVMSFALYLGRIYERKHAAHTGLALPSLGAVSAAAPTPAVSSAPAAKPASAAASAPSPVPADGKH